METLEIGGVQDGRIPEHGEQMIGKEGGQTQLIGREAD